MKVPGHIALLFGSFLGLPKNRPNMDPRTPYLSQKHLKNTGKSQNALKHIIYISQHFRNPFFKLLDPVGHQK